MSRALIAWGPAVAWAAVLFLLSELPGVKPIVWLAVRDKLVHFGLYGVLGATLAWGHRKSPRPVPHWVAIGLGFAYGAVDELHQRFTPNRMPSFGDFTADVVGVIVGYALVVAIWSWKTPARTRAS